MSRVGWIFLAVVLAIGAVLASMTSFGIGGRDAPANLGATIPERVPAATGALQIPVAGVSRTAIVDSWGDDRAGGMRAHHGTDILAPGGTPVIAAAPGRVEKLFGSEAGGVTVYIRSRDGRWSYYYAHLAGYVPGLAEGQTVRAGDPLGFVGDTGNAGTGNFHLHFGVSRMAPGGGWSGGQPVNPYPLLAGTARPR